METSSQDSVTTSQPCTEDDILMDLEGCNQLEEMTEFLEIEFLGMRIWQFVGIIMLITLFVIITLCCCFRFRIPRTKQEIDADYVRKKLAKNFTKQLADISDTKMVEMDMKKVLDEVQRIFEVKEAEDTKKMEDNEIIVEQPAHYYVQYQNHSTGTVLHFLSKKKNKRKINKKYAELLEVTDSSTNNTKAAVRNLNAAQLSLLVNQPDITLDKIHKIQMKKKKPKSDIVNQNKLAEDEAESVVEDLNSSGMTDETMVIKTSALAETLGKEELSEKCDETENEESLKSILEKEQAIREAEINKEKTIHLNKVILGYIDVCINSGYVNEANAKIKAFYDLKPKMMKSRIFIGDEAQVFNPLLQKYASNGDFKSVLLMLSILRKNNLPLASQMYSHIFYCIGRMNNTVNKLDLLKNIQEEMSKDNVTLNDILTKSVFIKNQRQIVQAMVKLLDKQFVPKYEELDKSYNCKLFNHIQRENTTPKSTVESLFHIDDLKERLKEQLKAEISGQVIVKNISNQNFSNKKIQHWRQRLSDLHASWEKVATEAFKRNAATLKTQESFERNRHLNLYPYLNILKTEDYIRVLMQEVQKLGMGSEMYSLPFHILCKRVGLQIFKKYEAKVKENNGVIDKTSAVYLDYCDWFIKRNNKENCRTQWMDLKNEANKEGVTLNSMVPPWHYNAYMNIGKFLFNILINDLKVDETYIKNKKRSAHYAPGFFKIFRHNGVMLKEEIKPHPYVSKLYRESYPETLTFDTTLVPSLCPPRPWVSINEGGYIVTQTDFVRANIGAQQLELLNKTPLKNLYPSFDSLNQLSSVPWTVNKSILDVAIKVFLNDGSEELNMPRPPKVLEPLLPLPRDAPVADRRQREKEIMELKRRKSEMYSLWCDALYRLSLANHFRDQIFWLPHNMDFRGRVYPVPPHLNHLGSDLARSMLIFALKKPLGPNGLNWLKLHTINLTGFKKKESISARLKYADEVMEDILDSAEKPLDGKMWWAKSDEPWQTLSACMEISAAMKSPDPEKFMSGFPIHQDGSCNGLQHYAALGRDEIGAKSVNLCPCDVPQDVYERVVEMVEELRKQDAENNNEIAQLLNGFVKRKVIKQTVMTTVYGVTWFGAKLQIARQLKDLDEFPQQKIWPASTYLVQKTFQSLRTMFKSAREIQDWFTDCARLICLARGQKIEWITPVGLPVVQPYTKLKTMNNSMNSYASPDISSKPNAMKQKNAFAPNYVHSLDSSHMILTSINSENAGITFVSVHDCYWTHPCTVEIMNKICREQFVALHSQPILEDLSKFFISRFGFDQSEVEIDNMVSSKTIKFQSLKSKLNTTVANVPKKGEFDLTKVLDSIYFFS